MQRAKSFVIGAGGVEICLCPDENCRPRFEGELAAEFARIRSEARAGMREACIAHVPTAHYEDDLVYITCQCGWDARKATDDLSGKTRWQQHLILATTPDYRAADEAIERIKREARLEEAKFWHDRPELSREAYVLNCPGCERIAALSGKETEQ